MGQAPPRAVASQQQDDNAPHTVGLGGRLAASSVPASRAAGSDSRRPPPAAAVVSNRSVKEAKRVLAAVRQGAPVTGQFTVTSVRAHLPEVDGVPEAEYGSDRGTSDEDDDDDDDDDGGSSARSDASSSPRRHRSKSKRSSRRRRARLRRRHIRSRAASRVDGGVTGTTLRAELPFLSASLEPARPIATRVPPKRPLGVCTHVLEPAHDREAGWWHSVVPDRGANSASVAAHLDMALATNRARHLSRRGRSVGSDRRARAAVTAAEAAAAAAAGKAAGTAGAEGVGAVASDGQVSGTFVGVDEAGTAFRVAGTGSLASGRHDVGVDDGGASVQLAGAVRLSQDDVYVDAWTQGPSGVTWLGAGVIHIAAMVESALEAGNGGVSTTYDVRVELFNESGSRRAGVWWVEVQFRSGSVAVPPAPTWCCGLCVSGTPAQRQPVARADVATTAISIPDVKRYNVVPDGAVVSGRLVVTVVDACFLREAGGTAHFVTACVGPDEALNLRPISVGAAQTNTKLGGALNVWSGGGLDVLGATASIEVRDTNVDDSWIYLEAFRDEEYHDNRLVGTGKLPFRRVVDDAARAGGLGRLHRMLLQLYAKSSRGSVSGLVPAGAVCVEMRFENAVLDPPRFILSKVVGRIVITSMHCTLAPRAGWAWGDAAMRPFLSACIEPRRRLGARRDPLLPRWACTSDVMRYHEEPQRLFVCDGRDDVGATLFLYPDDNDNVHVDDSALYFEAWTRHPKRCGSVCMFLGAGMADLRPIVEAAARAGGLGARIALSVPLFTGRGTKRTGTWHLEAGFESSAYEPAPEPGLELDTRPPVAVKDLPDALPRNTITTPTGVFVLRVRKVALAGKLAHRWDVFVKVLLEAHDELVDRKHSTRSPSKGERSAMTSMPAQVDNWGVALWHSHVVRDSLLEIPATSVDIDSHSLYVELWGSDLNTPIVLGVGEIMARPLVQSAMGALEQGFGLPLRLRVPLFHNAHGVMFPNGHVWLEAWYETDTRAHLGTAAQLLGLGGAADLTAGRFLFQAERAQYNENVGAAYANWGRTFLSVSLGPHVPLSERRKPSKPHGQRTAEVAAGGKTSHWGSARDALVTLRPTSGTVNDTVMYVEAWLRDAEGAMLFVGVGVLQLPAIVHDAAATGSGTRTFFEVELFSNKGQKDAGRVYCSVRFVDDRVASMDTGSAALFHSHNRATSAVYHGTAASYGGKGTSRDRGGSDGGDHRGDGRGDHAADGDANGERGGRRLRDAPLGESEAQRRFGRAARIAHAARRFRESVGFASAGPTGTAGTGVAPPAAAASSSDRRERSGSSGSKAPELPPRDKGKRRHRHSRDRRSGGGGGGGGEDGTGDDSAGQDGSGARKHKSRSGSRSRGDSRGEERHHRSSRHAQPGASDALDEDAKGEDGDHTSRHRRRARKHASDVGAAEAVAEVGGQDDDEETAEIRRRVAKRRKEREAKRRAREQRRAELEAEIAAAEAS